MTEAEWLQFKAITNAQWRPRTVEEFNAMCNLAAAKAHADTPGGFGIINGLEAESIRFDENGEMKFPPNPRKQAFIKEFGREPKNMEELGAFERGELKNNYSTPKLDVITSSDSAA